VAVEVTCEFGLTGDVDRALGHEHVRPEVTIGSMTPGVGGEGFEALRCTALGPAGRVGVGERRFSELRDLADLNASGIVHAWAGRPGPLAVGRPPTTPESGGTDKADLEHAGHPQRNECRPDRNPAQVVLRPVDRIEDPGALRTAAHSELLAEDSVARALSGKDPAQALFDCLVGFGDRGEIRLRLDHEVVGAVERHGNGISGIGQLAS